jgi:hypothetical protein
MALVKHSDNGKRKICRGQIAAIGNGGMSYLDMIKYLNEIAPLSKVQFLESLGDAASHEVGEATLHMARVQVVEAVDAFISPNDGRWLYDNNIFRFVYGIVRQTALPYEHACTASNLTTIFPSGELMACYTFAEKPTLAFGSHKTIRQGPGHGERTIHSRREQGREDDPAISLPGCSLGLVGRSLGRHGWGARRV